MKIVQNVVPVSEPVTIATKETVTRQELRLRVVRKDDQQKVELRLWDVTADGTAAPFGEGYRLSFDDAARLRDALNDIDL